MHKAFDLIIGGLVVLCGIFLVLASFTAYNTDLRFKRGVIEPSVALQNLNETGTTTSAEECLTEHKIASVVRGGILYVSEQDFDDAIRVCA